MDISLGGFVLQQNKSKGFYEKSLLQKIINTNTAVRQDKSSKIKC